MYVCAKIIIFAEGINPAESATIHSRSPAHDRAWPWAISRVQRGGGRSLIINSAMTRRLATNGG